MFKKITAVLTTSTSIILGSAVVLSSNLAFPDVAKADFNVCNKAGGKIGVAFAYLDPNNTWISTGWWNLESGDCATLFKGNISARNNYWYVYGYGYDGTMWSGNNAFCTLRNKFTIPNADKSCNGSGKEWKNFQEVFTGSYDSFTYNFFD